MSSGSSTASSSSNGRLVVRPLPVAGIVFFVCFACLGLTPFAAPALMNPGWQLRFATDLITHGFLPLLGLACFYLDKYLTNRGASSPRPGTPDASTRLGHWAVAASLGFLLLFPLQIAAATSLITSNFSQLDRTKAPIERLNAMERIVREAPDAEAMQSRLTAIRGPVIPLADRRRPLPELKATLLGSLKQAQMQARSQGRNDSGRRTFILIFDCLRLSVMTLAYAVAFAAFGQRYGQRHTLLEEVVTAMRGGRTSIRVGSGY